MDDANDDARNENARNEICRLCCMIGCDNAESPAKPNPADPIKPYPIWSFGQKFLPASEMRLSFDLVKV